MFLSQRKTHTILRHHVAHDSINQLHARSPISRPRHSFFFSFPLDHFLLDLSPSHFIHFSFSTSCSLLSWYFAFAFLLSHSLFFILSISESFLGAAALNCFVLLFLFVCFFFFFSFFLRFRVCNRKTERRNITKQRNRSSSTQLFLFLLCDWTKRKELFEFWYFWRKRAPSTETFLTKRTKNIKKKANEHKLHRYSFKKRKTPS